MIASTTPKPSRILLLTFKLLKAEVSEFIGVIL
jgi:hypothetical protein